ncbi:hypothetical protein FQA39_LY12952 [Lamprigera yunnana]|nr:hypothetical protein FQA39_LY12952 [Lamprigera yunnana]
MLKEKRFELITNYVDENNFCRNEDMAQDLKIPLTTLRRDLTELHDLKHIVRVHGGAKSIEKDKVILESNFNDRIIDNLEAKKIIARKAIECIKQNETVFIDAGSTTYFLSTLIKPEMNLKIYTNSIINAKVLAENQIKDVHVIPGKVNITTFAIYGTEAMATLSKFNFDVAFLGVNAVDSNYNCYTTNEDESEIKKKIVEQSILSFGLCDSSKLNSKSFAKFAARNQIAIITEEKTNSNLDLGTTNYYNSEYISIGGKGINVAIVLNNLQANPKALGFEVEKETVTKFLNFLKTKIKKDDIVIATGSAARGVNKDVYLQIGNILNEKQAYFICDATNDLLKYSLKAKPYLIKPNLAEICETLDVDINTISTMTEITNLIKLLQKKGARNVLLSMGSKGSIYFDENQDKFEIGIAKGKLINSVGAGDSMVAGFTFGLAKQLAIEETLKYAAARKELLKTGYIKNEKTFISGINEREKQGSTGIGDVKFIFAILSNGKDGNEHLDAIAGLSQVLVKGENLAKLNSVKTYKELLDVMVVKEKKQVVKKQGKYDVVGITACPTGIAHTYLAAEKLEEYASELGLSCKIETQGRRGNENILTEEEIKGAKVVILAHEKALTGMSRFNNVELIQTTTKDAIYNGKELISTFTSNPKKVTLKNQSDDGGEVGELT